MVDPTVIDVADNALPGADSVVTVPAPAFMKANDVRDVKLAMTGFFDGQKVEDYVNEQVLSTPLEHLKIPTYVVATELKEGKKVVFNYGNTGQAVRASVSIPSMFIPTKIAGE